MSRILKPRFSNLKVLRCEFVGLTLMGVRSSVWSALLGALVIGSISNGMHLLAFDSSIKFMVTGAVLLAAATMDAVASRKWRTA